MKLSLILQAIDRLSAPARKAASAVRGVVDRGIKPLERSMQRLNAVERRFLSRLPARLRVVTAGVRALAVHGMGALRFAADKADDAVKRVMRSAGRSAMRWLKYGAVGLAGLGVWATKGILDRAALFEQTQLTLETMLGSADKAKAAMKWVEEFAVKTPYELTDVIEGFTRLQVLDFSPMTGSLEALGNAAAALGKDLPDAIDAMASAAAGEFEPLRRYGIRISKQGAQLVLSYRMMGKEFRKTIKDNQSALEDGITEIFTERFPGMMDKQSRTFKGLWSNIVDAFGKFQGMIADAGFFDFAKSKLQRALDWVDSRFKDGTAERWAARISDALERAATKAWEFAKGIDWDGVAKGMMAIVAALMKIVSWIGTAASKWRRWQLQMERTRQGAFLGSMLGNAFYSEEDFKEARARIRAINRELGDPLATSIPRSQLEKSTNEAVAEAQRKADNAELDRKYGRITKNSGNKVPLREGPMPQFWWQLDQSPAPTPTPSPNAKPKITLPTTSDDILRRLLSGASAKPQKPAEAKVTMEVKTAPGVTATPTKISATGMKLQVRTGPAMAGMA